MKKWNEKALYQKVLDIISSIALVVWVIFGVLERNSKMKYAGYVYSAAVLVICVCEAISFWNEKRSLSYVAIAGAVFMTVVTVLQIILLA